MTQPGTAHPPNSTKSIRPSLDRLQSRLLLWTIGAAVIAATAWILIVNVLINKPCCVSLIQPIIISAAFALLAWRLKAATPFASACGGMVCFLLIFCRSHDEPWRSAFLPLAALFLLTFLSTRAGRARKLSSGLAESRRGRSASQVIANLGLAAIVQYPLGALAFEPLSRNPAAIDLVVLAILAEAAADTVSSELGQAFGGRPFLLTTLRRVPTGTDGAITALGTLAGIAAAAVVVAVGAWSVRLTLPAAIAALVAATLGMLFDSFLGATLERGGYLGNDLVNFLSTAFAAAVTLAAIFLAQNILTGASPAFN